MKTLLKLEDLAKLVFAYVGTLYLGFEWWLFFALLLAPDLGMLGYLVNPKVGAWLYNLFHHQGVAIIVGILGLYMGQEHLQFAGLLLFGHSAMDRALGYGLKYNDHFKHTHLGWIGPETKRGYVKS
ncbi:DUF4260 domain-containing protein [Pontibacter burrus]|uniref:DUF4260 domain-containing protein n=1 Tax=Pontibacter burrus TaxID=2704466 RepID=A0A6B3LXC7_9BACT|nr:DUF4260 domain-containing protein [Pontibacter burrus]NEM98468.1 DUF4260 domain-containing protein [Pontibacter burrus]